MSVFDGSGNPVTARYMAHTRKHAPIHLMGKGCAKMPAAAARMADSGRFFLTS